MPGIRIGDEHLRAALPPDRFAAEILELERELDELHPPWRQPMKRRRGRPGIVGSRGIEDIETKSRVKWLLQRRKYLYAGKDWDVTVSAVEKRDGSFRLFAHPLIPRQRHTARSLARAARYGRRSSSSDSAPAAPAAPSLPAIAFELGVSLERVERAVLDAPRGADLLSYARSRLNQES